MTKIIMIAAASENHAIGKENDLMWHLPDDFKHFKTKTTGHTMIMGRKTFESFPKPLPKRRHIILTRDTTYTVDHENCQVVHSMEAALKEVANETLAFIIGGGEIYRQAEPFADVIELTRVHHIFEEAEAFFPLIDETHWQLISEKHHPKDERHLYAFTFLTYHRK